MSQQAMALLEQIRALEPQDREWIGAQLFQDDQDGEIDDLTEDPVFYEEMVRRLNDPSPGLTREEVLQWLDDKTAAGNRERNGECK